MLFVVYRVTRDITDFGELTRLGDVSLEERESGILRVVQNSTTTYVTSIAAFVEIVQMSSRFSYLEFGDFYNVFRGTPNSKILAYRGHWNTRGTSNCLFGISERSMTAVARQLLELEHTHEG